MVFRRPSSLVAQWGAGGFEVRNYARGTCAVIGPVEFSILEACRLWATPEEVQGRVSSLGNGDVKTVMTRLASDGLLESSELVSSERERAVEGWSPWGLAATLFHLDTRDVDYADEESGRQALLRRHASFGPVVPEPAHDVRLPPCETAGAFPSALLARRTWRRFGSRALTLQQLSTLLGLTWGVQRWIHTGMGPVALKTSPSGGACHSLKAYALVRNVRGVPPGIYRYLPDGHGLVRERDAWSDEELVARMGRQAWVTGAGVIVFMSSEFDRVRRKYTFGRAYRVVLMEAGHFCQTFCLVATWLGLAPFCTAALADSKIDADLGCDGMAESVLYAMGVGTRAPGGARDPRGEMVPRTSPPLHKRRSRG